MKFSATVNEATINNMNICDSMSYVSLTLCITVYISVGPSFPLQFVL